MQFIMSNQTIYLLYTPQVPLDITLYYLLHILVMLSSYLLETHTSLILTHNNSMDIYLHLMLIISQIPLTIYIIITSLLNHIISYILITIHLYLLYNYTTYHSTSYLISPSNPIITTYSIYYYYYLLSILSYLLCITHSHISYCIPRYSNYTSPSLDSITQNHILYTENQLLSSYLYYSQYSSNNNLQYSIYHYYYYYSTHNSLNSHFWCFLYYYYYSMETYSNSIHIILYLTLYIT